MIFDQKEFQVRCEWSLRGLEELAPKSDVLIIVDVLSFSTAVDIASARGARVFPYPLKGKSVREYALSVGADLASNERSGSYSLSPTSMRNLPLNHRLVLPSPNGATLAFSANHSAVFTACLRNASAVARAAPHFGSTFAVIPAGESWPGGDLRPCLEDWVGAGAVISSLPGKRSPEAQLAAFTFERARHNLSGWLRDTGSGKELIERGYLADVEVASELDVSCNVPLLQNRAFASYSSID